jgi:hypothetical protein
MKSMFVAERDAEQRGTAALRGGREINDFINRGHTHYVTDCVLD